jgi:ceramide glucosyltransferase
MSWSVWPDLPCWLAAAFAAFGLVQAVAGGLAVQRFSAKAKAHARPRPTERRPPVTLLKPLHGDEPMLLQALASFCVQDYPEYQIVFGIAHPSDAARAVVEQLRADFPDADISLVVNQAQHGRNRKISNLINMLPTARHDFLVIADSDLHVAPDYLDRVVAELMQPGAGLVTTLYVGWAAAERLAERLGASQITYSFLPGALLARALGRQDNLGVTMALRRETLAQVGGLPALVDHVADDAVLGRLVRALGLTVRLGATMPATTVADATIRAGFRHELRWARTIRSLAPVGFVASALQYPMAWAGSAMLLSGGAAWSLALFAGAWGMRAAVAHAIDRALAPMTRPCAHRRALRAPLWLLPLREAMSVCVMMASYRTRRVHWRGHTMYVGRPPSTRTVRPLLADARGRNAMGLASGNARTPAASSPG